MLTDLTDPLAFAARAAYAPPKPSAPSPPPPEPMRSVESAVAAHGNSVAPSPPMEVDSVAVQYESDRAADIRELRELPPDDGIPNRSVFSNVLYAEERLGLPWMPPSQGGLRPSEGVSLSRWQVTDAGERIAPPPQATHRAPSRDGPRLAVAAMLRAAPPAVVDGFLRYYHGIGFEQVVLFFDKPEEDAEAVKIAQRHAEEAGGVTIHLCNDKWWAAERKTGRSFVRARALAAAPDSDGDDDTAKFSKFRWYGDSQNAVMVERTNDVQSRQAVVMSRALSDAWSAGFDWLLQLDIDELLYLPREAEREDARLFFAKVPLEYDRVAFHNHEVMPCESLDASDWFEERCLFKVSPHLLSDFQGSTRETERASRRRRANEGEDLEPYAIAEPGGEAGNSAISDAMRPIARAREPALMRLHELGLRLPTRGQVAKDSQEAAQKARHRQLMHDDDKRIRYMEQAKIRAERAKQRQAEQEASGDANGGPNGGGEGGPNGGGGGGEGGPNGGTGGKGGAAVVAGKARVPDRYADLLKESGLEQFADMTFGDILERDTRPDTSGAAHTYFTAHAQGKQACRLRPFLDPPGGGVHGISMEGRAGRTLTCVGAHDPCVLHYANCGLSYWIRKYQVLGDIPNYEDRKTLEGFAKHQQAKQEAEGGQVAAGEKDGSFSTHMAARDLVVYGVGRDQQSRDEALTLFYRTLFMGNDHGEAAHLAACGMLVRVRGVSTLLKRLRAAPRRFRKALGPAAPPKLVPVLPERWLSEPMLGGVPLKDLPYRRRHCQWRVVHTSKIVARARPNTKAPLSQVFEPGELLWSGPPRPDGWVPLSDPSNVSYVLIDAASLGLGRLLERVDPPILDGEKKKKAGSDVGRAADGASAPAHCSRCWFAPCCCALLEAYGQ